MKGCEPRSKRKKEQGLQTGLLRPTKEKGRSDAKRRKKPTYLFALFPNVRMLSFQHLAIDSETPGTTCLSPNLDWCAFGSATCFGTYESPLVPLFDTPFGPPEIAAPPVCKEPDAGERLLRVEVECGDGGVVWCKTAERGSAEG